jgi:hypothetical protein
VRTVTGLKDGDRLVAIRTLNVTSGPRIEVGTELEFERMGASGLDVIWVRAPGRSRAFVCCAEHVDVVGGSR